MIKKIKRIVCFILVCSVLTALLPIHLSAAPSGITASSYVLMDLETGQVLYQKNMNEAAYPASITKIMTLLLAVEKLNPDTTVTVSADATVLDKPGISDTSHIALTSGENMRVEDVEYGAFLASANDAANVLAEAVSGSNEEFAKLMNQRAKECGAINTNFVNPHGLPNENHVTTAYDMAMIMREALKNEAFLKIASTVIYNIPPDNKKKEVLPVASGLAMMKSTDPLYYDGIIGGKTGYTVPAGYTGVVAAERRGMRLVVAVLGSSSGADRFNDMKILLDYGFDNFVKNPITTDDIRPTTAGVVENDMTVATVAVKPFDGMYYLRHISVNAEDIVLTKNISDSYNQYDINPTVSLKAPDTGDMYPEIGSFALQTTVTQLSNPIAVKKNSGQTAEQGENKDTSDENKDTQKMSSGLKIFLIILAVVFILVGGIVVLFVISNIRRRKRELERRRKRRAMYEKSMRESFPDGNAPAKKNSVGSKQKKSQISSRTEKSIR